MTHIVVIGAGQAGAACVAKLRAKGFEGKITLIGAETAPPYQRPPLSKKYLLGEMDLERLYLRPESYYADQNITLRLGTTVQAIDTTAQTVSLAEEILSYDHLVLTTGASPIRLPAAIGGDLDGVYTSPLHPPRGGPRPAAGAAGPWRGRTGSQGLHDAQFNLNKVCGGSGKHNPVILQCLLRQLATLHPSLGVFQSIFRIVYCFDSLIDSLNGIGSIQIGIADTQGHLGGLLGKRFTDGALILHPRDIDLFPSQRKGSIFPCRIQVCIDERDIALRFKENLVGADAATCVVYIFDDSGLIKLRQS